jgi:hypothetical protein
MKTNRLSLKFLILSLSLVPLVSAQTQKSTASSVALPKLLLLVHQQIIFGKETERRKLEVATTRACDHLNVPNSWIDLESITGEPEALFFDALDSFEQLDKAFLVWGQLFAAHPELAQMQEQIKALVASERTVIAVRRDDLGFRATTIDLSKARFLRVLQVRLHPGHEIEFGEAFKILSAAYEKINASTPWIVYQVNVGTPTPTFLVFVPMHALQQNDDLLAWRKSLREAEGDAPAYRMDEIARDAFEETESNLYAVSPEMSHVSKEFAAGDPQFWSPERPAASKPYVRKNPGSTKK